jgi:hypothetical protein
MQQQRSHEQHIFLRILLLFLFLRHQHESVLGQMGILSGGVDLICSLRLMVVFLPQLFEQARVLRISSTEPKPQCSSAAPSSAVTPRNTAEQTVQPSRMIQRHFDVLNELAADASRSR